MLIFLRSIKMHVQQAGLLLIIYLPLVTHLFCSEVLTKPLLSTEEEHHKHMVAEVNAVINSRLSLLNACKLFEKETLQNTFDAIDQEKIFSENLSWLVRQQRKALLSIASFVLKNDLNLHLDKDILFLLSKNDAKTLHEIVESLCKKLNIPVPLIFICNNMKCFGAHALSLSHNAAMIVIGSPLIQQLSTKELTSIIAHELGHIQLHHSTKRALAFIGTPLAITLATYMLTDKAIHYFSDKTSLPTHDSFLKKLLLSLITAIAAHRHILAPFYKHQEDQADSVAIKLMQDPNPLCKAFNSIRKLEDLYELEYKSEQKKVHAYIDAALEKKNPYAARHIKKIPSQEGWLRKIFNYFFQIESHHSDEERIALIKKRYSP